MSNAVIGGNIWNPFDTDKENTGQKVTNKKAKLYKRAGIALALLSVVFFLGMGSIFIFNMKTGVTTSSSGDLMVDYRPFPILATLGISMVAIFLILATFTCFRRSEKAILGSSSPSDMFDKIIVGSFIILSLLVNISGPVQAASFDAVLAPKLQEWANSKGILMTEDQAQGITKYASKQAFNGTKESGAPSYSLNGEYKNLSIYRSGTNKYEFSFAPSKISK